MGLSPLLPALTALLHLLEIDTLFATQVAKTTVYTANIKPKQLNTPESSLALSTTLSITSQQKQGFHIAITFTVSLLVLQVYMYRYVSWYYLCASSRDAFTEGVSL